MNHWVMRAMLQILPVITTLVLFLPGSVWAQTTPEPSLQIKGPYNGGGAYSVAFSPDGKILASGNDRMIWLWDVSAGRLIRSFAGHSGPVTVLAFSPDGKTLASGGSDRTIKLWDVGGGRPIRLINGPIGKVYSVDFSPDGKMLASASEEGHDEGRIKLWDVSTGRLIRALDDRNLWVTSVAFSPDGKTLASGSEQIVKLWDAWTGKLIRSFVGHRNTVHSVAFSPNGKTLASGSSDHRVRIWEVSTGKLIHSFAEQDCKVVAFSPDGKMLAAGNHDRTVKLWDVNSGNLIHSFKDPDHDDVSSLAFSPDGKTLVGDGQKIKVWSVGAKTLMGSLLQFNDGNWIAYVPGNYYVSSEGAAQYISWRVGREDYDEPQFRSRFYQPDLVAAGLRGEKIAVVLPSQESGGSRPNTSGDTTANKKTTETPVTTEPIRPPIKDTTAPKIVITSPSVTRGVGVQSTAGKMTVKGRASDASGVKQVVVQGAAARLDARGNFSVEVALRTGDNLITITATDVHDNQANESFVVRRDPTVAPVAATATGNGGRYHALLIAVQEYDHPSVNRLDFPVGDAQQVERELTSRYAFEPQNVTTLKNPDRRTILDALDQMTEKLKPEDNLLIFYAGHGQWDEQRKQGYWLPRDAMRDRRADWISNSDLRDAIRGIKARHILLISDACFAGGIFLAREAFGPASSAIAELDNLPSRTAMTSGALTTVPDRSVFVEYLLKRLRENTDDLLPALELFNKLRLPVINNSPAQRDGSRPTPRYGTIFEVGDEGGDFIFVRRR